MPRSEHTEGNVPTDGGGSFRGGNAGGQPEIKGVVPTASVIARHDVPHPVLTNSHEAASPVVLPLITRDQTPQSALSESAPPPLRPRDLIQGDLATTDQALQALNTRLVPLYEQIDAWPQDQQDICDGIGEGGLTVEEALAQLPAEHAPVVRGLEEGFQQELAMRYREEDLKKEMLPYVVDDIRKQVADLHGRIDYDKVFDYSRGIIVDRKSYDAAGEISATGKGIFFVGKVKQKLANGEIDTPDYAETVVDYLNSYKKEWEERGFLREIPVIMPELSEIDKASLEEQRLQVVQKANEAARQLYKYRMLVSTYRRLERAQTEVVDWGLATALDVIGYDQPESSAAIEGIDDYEFDPRFIQAGIRHIEAVLTEHREAGRIAATEAELTAQKEQIAAMDPVTAVEGIAFRGFEPPEGMVSVITPDEIRQIMIDRIPPDFTRKLIQVAHESADGLSHGDDPHVTTAGLFSPIFGEGDDSDMVVATAIGLYVPLFVPEDAIAGEKYLARAELEQTLWHEVGHNAHSLLDYDEMVDWENASADGTVMTWNIGYAKAEDENTGKREDFADSFQLIQTHPALLREFSPSRYEFMWNYFSKHLTPEQFISFKSKIETQLATAQAIWESVGVSRAQLKYDYHITESGDPPTHDANNNEDRVPRIGHEEHRQGRRKQISIFDARELVAA